jgi:beta-phosphoglucomutase
MGFAGAIFDVDGVLVDSPHERAWAEALRELMAGDWRELQPLTSYTPQAFTPALYQQVMAGKPRLAGARAALEHFGVPDPERHAVQYADRKQRRVVQLILAGEFRAFPDALRFIVAVAQAGTPVACASSSKNARLLLERIHLDGGAGRTLLEVFDADVTGREFPRGKPDPAIFLAAAEELRAPPARCFVVEDAPSGIEAAKAGGMAGLGVARLHDQALLQQAGADLVVGSLDQVDMGALAEGRLVRSGPA